MSEQTRKHSKSEMVNALLNMIQGTETRSEPPHPDDDDMILNAAITELAEKDWQVYVPGMLKRGEWVQTWDAINEEPFFGEFRPGSDKGYGDFVKQNGDQIGEETVTHIMRIKAPEGRKGHWEND